MRCDGGRRKKEEDEEMNVMIGGENKINSK